MVLGMGVDLQSHQEMDLPVDDPFILRVFTEAERTEAMARADRSAYLAGRFAVKEAAVKALALDTNRVRLSDIETVDDAFGAPHTVLTGALAEAARARGVRWPVMTSISHKDGMSVAVVLLQD